MYMQCTYIFIHILLYVYVCTMHINAMCMYIYIYIFIRRSLCVAQVDLQTPKFKQFSCLSLPTQNTFLIVYTKDKILFLPN